MKRTGILKQKEITENLASGYVKQNSKIVKEPYFHIQNYSSAGAMYSTAEDMLLWNTALLTNKLCPRKYRTKCLRPTEKLGFVALGSWSYPLRAARQKNHGRRAARLHRRLLRAEYNRPRQRFIACLSEQHRNANALYDIRQAGFVLRGDKTLDL
jgi:hypothetical protein